MSRKTIDGVSLELLKLCYRALNGGDNQLTGMEHGRAFRELRALLDARAEDTYHACPTHGDTVEGVCGACDSPQNQGEPIYDEAAELNRLFGAAREMLRIAGIANQGSNAYNRAIVNLHEAVTACAQSRAKAGEVGHE